MTKRKCIANAKTRISLSEHDSAVFVSQKRRQSSRLQQKCSDGNAQADNEANTTASENPPSPKGLLSLPGELRNVSSLRIFKAAG
jgi:hypothetical protein